MRVLAGVLVVIAACGGGGGSDAGVAILPLDQFGPQIAAAECAKIFQCCDAAEIAQQFADASPPVTTEAQCESYLAGVHGGSAYQTSLAAGRIAYRGDYAAVCVGYVEQLTCGDYAELLGSLFGPAVLTCSTAIVPNVPSGGACAHDYECETDNCTGGTCQRLPEVGQPCTHVCDYGFCGVDPASGSQVCYGELGAGASCASNGECESGVCVGASGSGGGTCGEAPVCDGSGG